MTRTEIIKIMTLLSQWYPSYKLPQEDDDEAWDLAVEAWELALDDIKFADLMQHRKQVFAKAANGFAPSAWEVVSRYYDLQVPRELDELTGESERLVWEKVDRLCPDIDSKQQFSSPEEHQRAVKIKTAQRIKVAREVYEQMRSQLAAKVTSGATLGAATREVLGVSESQSPQVLLTRGDPSEELERTASPEEHVPPTYRDLSVRSRVKRCVDILVERKQKRIGRAVSRQKLEDEIYLRVRAKIVKFIKAGIDSEKAVWLAL